MSSRMRRFGRWGVNDAVVGVAGDRGAVVVKLTPIGVVGEEVLEELFAGGRVVAFGAGCTFAGGKTGMRDATTETTAERAGVTALVFGVGVRGFGV